MAATAMHTAKPGLPYLLRVSLLFGAAIMGGLVIGGIVAFIAQFFYLIFLFPLIMGGIAAFVMVAGVNGLKIPNAAIAALAAVVLSTVLYTTLHYGQYLTFLQQAHADVALELGDVDAASVDGLIDLFLLEETGATGFVGYMLLQVDSGFSVGRATSSSSLPISGSIIWIYWFIEFAVITGIAAIAAAGATSKPFCQTCQEWYTSQRLGSVNRGAAQQFLQAVQMDDFQQAHDMVQQEALPTPSLEVYLRRCPSCESSELHLAVEASGVDSRGRPKTQQVLDRVISHDQLQMLTPAVA